MIQFGFSPPAQERIWSCSPNINTYLLLLHAVWIEVLWHLLFSWLPCSHEMGEIHQGSPWYVAKRKRRKCLSSKRTLLAVVVFSTSGQFKLSLSKQDRSSIWGLSSVKVLGNRRQKRACFSGQIEWGALVLVGCLVRRSYELQSWRFELSSGMLGERELEGTSTSPPTLRQNHLRQFDYLFYGV